MVSSLFLSWCRNGFQGPPVGSALLVRTEVQDSTAFRTCPIVSSARKTVGQRGKTRFEMCGSRSPSVENSSKSFSMYMKESWWRFLKIENNPGHLCDTINNKLKQRNKFSKLLITKTQITINHVRKKTELSFLFSVRKIFNYKILTLHRGHPSEQSENVGEKVLQKCIKKSPQMLLFWSWHCSICQLYNIGNFSFLIILIRLFLFLNS